jgi:hypothetical protein
MTVAGALHLKERERRVWVAIVVGQLLHLTGDALWYMVFGGHADRRVKVAG